MYTNQQYSKVTLMFMYNVFFYFIVLPRNVNDYLVVLL